jgi:hypothetical protein
VLQFPFPKLFSPFFLPKLVEKINETYVFPLLNDCCYATTNFDMWMSKGAHDMFALVKRNLGFNWKPKQITLVLFKVVKTIGQPLPINLIDILDAYGLKNKIITYEKDEASNLNTLTNALKSVVKCETSSLEESF